MSEMREAARVMTPAVMAFACISALLVTGCANEDEPGDLAFAGTAVSVVTNPRVSAVASHLDGSMMVALEELGQSGVKGAVFIAESGETFTVLFDRSRRPIQAQSSGFTFVFDSYRGLTVEMGVIDPSGVTTLFRDVAIDAALLARRQLAPFHDNIQVAASALLVSGCAVAGAIDPNGPSIVNPCGAPILTALSNYADTETRAVEESAASIGSVSELSECTASLPVRCAGLIADLGVRLAVESESAMAKHSTEIPTIVAALRFGGLWAVRDADHDWYLVEPKGVAYVTKRDSCFEFRRGDFLDVTDDVFTYRDLTTRFAIPGEYKVSTDGAVLSVFGYDQRKWGADRSEMDPAELAPECAPPS